MSFPKKVFVYGTLKRGHVNHGLMKGAHLIGEAYSWGWKMYHLGGFPGIIPNENESDSLVHGELYEVNNPYIIRRLDRLEGVRYDPKTGESCGLYHRTTTTVHDVASCTTHGDCLVYEFNAARGLPAREVEGGNWIK